MKKLETITGTNFDFEGLTGFYKGKVRDVYTYRDSKMIFVVSDRISAFDVVLPRAIPYKGEILNLIAAKFLKITENIVPNWLIDVPDPAVSIGHKCESIPVEMVIRGYLCGHAWREYKAGKRLLSGVPMPEGLIENQKFPKPIITPTTKAIEGHDEDISREEIIESGLVSRDVYEKLEDFTFKLFERGTEYAAKMGLILVDTKYEFGLYKGQIYLIDEIHTPDSSRYFYSEDYQIRFMNGQPQKQLSKEFVREWLMEKGFQGRAGDVMPEMTDEVVEMVMNRYVELYEIVTGEKFNYSDRNSLDQRLYNNITSALKRLE
jgi:phosphoribosylaminoimidazole-succinocarboxamide synthase